MTNAGVLTYLESAYLKK